MDFAGLMAAAAAETTKVVRGIGPDQLDLPTPCADWDVRTLANHLTVWGGYASELAARKQPLPESLGESHDFIVGDWRGTFAEQVAKAAAAWDEPGAWDGTTYMGQTAMPSSLVGGMLLGELVCHGGDLAVATGQPYRCDDAAVAAAYEVTAQVAEQGRSMDVFTEPVAVPESVPPLHRLLALTGRDPAWRP
jgi:uncharacterized protein (TIGR03086 family)